MKVAALAAIGAFIILPAEAVERHGENNSPAAICDNDGHCATLGAAVPVASARRNRPGIKSDDSDRAASAFRARRQRQYGWRRHFRQDRCTCSRWHRLCRTVSSLYRRSGNQSRRTRAVHGAAFVPADVRFPANIRAGKR